MTADPGFDLFLGIDWSGAKGARNKGIQVAEAAPDEALPRLIANPYRPHGIWSRPDVLSYLIARMDEGRHVLAGFDFAFCYAFEDEGAYFPGLPDAPGSPEAVWALVEQAGQCDPDLYGAALYRRADLPYRDYFMAPGWRGAKYSYRQRLAEQAAASVTGSLAGMRLLHRLRGLDRDIRLWPFDPEPGGALTVVDAVCRHFGAVAGEIPGIRTEDEADALISAAALRLLQADPALWQQARRAGAAKEGWIFGAA